MEKTDLIKLALMCAASGRHNILFVGPHGCGKTIALQKFQSLLPDLTEEEARREIAKKLSLCVQKRNSLR